jgi:hypothetical protein
MVNPSGWTGNDLIQTDNSLGRMNLTVQQLIRQTMLRILQCYPPNNAMNLVPLIEQSSRGNYRPDL